MENINFACALTGHRVLKKDFSKEKLKEIFIKLMQEQKVNTFYCGMAIGFDLTACEILYGLKQENYPIKIVACIPCPGQSDKFYSFQKEKYDFLLSICDEKTVISPQYDRACMHIRNRYMVDRAQFLVAYCYKNIGGSASTVRYAQKKERDIIFV